MLWFEVDLGADKLWPPTDLCKSKRVPVFSLADYLSASCACGLIMIFLAPPPRRYLLTFYVLIGVPIYALAMGEYAKLISLRYWLPSP
jgi:hypothetical protein